MMNRCKRIQQRPSAQYQKYADVFLKNASDEIWPHWSNDYQIWLEEGHLSEHAVEYSSLYKQSAKELAAASDHVIDNLSKEFVESAKLSLFLQSSWHKNQMMCWLLETKFNHLRELLFYIFGEWVDEVTEQSTNLHQAWHMIRISSNLSNNKFWRPDYFSNTIWDIKISCDFFWIGKWTHSLSTIHK